MQTKNLNYLSWISCLCVGFYYSYEMMQLTLVNSLTTHLVENLHFTVQQLSLFSSSYLYACALMMLPAGIMIDRYPLKPLLIITCVLSLLGILITILCKNF